MTDILSTVFKGQKVIFKRNKLHIIRRQELQLV